jgi:hypothetical protein
MAAADACTGSATARNTSSAWVRGLRDPRRKAIAKRAPASNADVPPIQLGLSHRLEADFPPSEARAASLRLHASIRRQLKDGATDALSIATESESGTLKPQES